MFPQLYDHCRLMNKLYSTRKYSLSDSDVARVRKAFLVSSMDNVVQYASLIWDHSKYSFSSYHYYRYVSGPKRILT